MGCYYHYCPCQEARPSLTDDDIERGVKKRQQDEMRRDYIQQKGYELVELWECEWWSLYINFLSAKNNSCNKLSMGDFLVMSNVILK